MYLKILLVGLLLMTVGNAYAWDDEGGYEEGEYVNVESGIDEYGNRWVNYSPDNPHWYDSIFKLIYKIIGFFHSDTDITIEIETACEKWDGDSYEEDDTRAMFSDTLTHNANNTMVTIVSTDPAEEYFKNNTNAIDTFTTIEDDPDHPDLLNVSVTISGGGVDYQENGYTAITDEGLVEIKEKITSPDYGFALDGRGADGGSGSIYESVNMYGGTGEDASGMGSSFNVIFWVIIPLIFVLAAVKFMSRVM